MTQPIKIGIDFGITNTDVVIFDNSVLTFKTFPSKGAPLEGKVLKVNTELSKITTSVLVIPKSIPIFIG